jgi:hypothetical protein
MTSGQRDAARAGPARAAEERIFVTVGRAPSGKRGGRFDHVAATRLEKIHVGRRAAEIHGVVTLWPSGSEPRRVKRFACRVPDSEKVNYRLLDT